MSKEIDINNEEQILKECDFDYYYNSVCSRELCMFFNDIARQDSHFDKRQAYIDLGRIGIMINKLFRENIDLEAKLAELDSELAENVRENECLKEHLAEKECEIKQLNARILISQLQAPEEQILNILGSQCIQYNPDQDKISFAVEQLDKVKELVLIESKEYPIVYEISDDIVGGAIDKDKCFKIIDNQIEELKKENINE